MSTTITPDSTQWELPKNIVRQFDVELAARPLGLDCSGAPNNALLLTKNSTRPQDLQAALDFTGSGVTVYGAALANGTHRQFATFLDSGTDGNLREHNSTGASCVGVLATFTGLDPAVPHRLVLALSWSIPQSGPGAGPDPAPYLAIYSAVVTGGGSTSTSSTPATSTTASSAGSTSVPPQTVPTQSSPSSSQSPTAPSTQSPAPPQTGPTQSSPSSSQGPAAPPTQSPSAHDSSPGDDSLPASSQTPVTAQRNPTLLAIAIAAPLAAAVIAMLFLLWCLKRRRTRRRRDLPSDDVLHPFVQQPPAAPAAAWPRLTVRISPETSSAGEKQHLLKPPLSSLSQASSSGLLSPESSYSGSSMPSAEPPEDIAALHVAVRRAGFSIQSVVASLNRLSTAPLEPPAIEGDAPPPVYAERRL